jgi:hypothetical protein
MFFGIIIRMYFKIEIMYPAIMDVRPGTDYTLLLTFDNGDKRLFNMKPYLNRGIFRELMDTSKFNTVQISFDTIAWDNQADFDPEVLYS